jgi:hypothetical protein
MEDQEKEIALGDIHGQKAESRLVRRQSEI